MTIHRALDNPNLKKDKLVEETTSGECDWCGEIVTTLASRCLPEQGLPGRVEEVCWTCRTEHDKYVVSQRNSLSKKSLDDN